MTVYVSLLFSRTSGASSVPAPSLPDAFNHAREFLGRPN